MFSALLSQLTQGPILIVRPCQTEVIAQGLTRVLMPEDPAFSELWDHMVDKDLDAGGERLWHQIEAVRRASQKPLLDGVCDLCCRLLKTARNWRSLLAVENRVKMALVMI
jgi:hypothetical protein